MADRKKKSEVWLYFDFAREDGQTVKTKVTCKLCKATMPYSGNTTNMRSHLDRYHWSVSINVR